MFVRIKVINNKYPSQLQYISGRMKINNFTSTVIVPETASLSYGRLCNAMICLWDGLMSNSSTPTIPRPRNRCGLVARS